MKLNIKLLSIFVLLSVTSSCKKFLDTGVPKTQLVSSAVFNDDKTATSAVAGMYSNIYALSASNSTFGGFGATALPALSADELTKPTVPTDFYLTNNIPVDEGNTATIWQSCYSAIYQANDIIAGLAASDKVTPALKNQLTGEALFIRAFSHFYLTNFFGDVPIVTSTDVTVSSALARSPVKDVYKQITDDLNQANQLLVSDYTTYFAGERVRVNKWVATAFLAKVYLYEGNWTDAETNATTVINNTSLFGLIVDPNAVFLKNSKEAIWQFLPYSGAGYTTLGIIMLPSTATTVPAYSLTGNLMAAFEPGDLRKADWIKANIANGTTYYYPYKYKNKVGQLVNTGEYDMVLRLAEQYLIRAEARTQSGNFGTSSSGAIGDLNAIRTRAGLPNTAASDKPSLLLAIEQERRIELMVEWGNRWFDLKRTNRIDAVLGAEKTGWKSTDALYPVPSAERTKNPLLTQNPGY